MPYTDIDKRRACHKRYYERNKQLYYEKNLRRRRELTEFVNQLKDKPCADCGVKYPPYVMDFDHRDWDSKLNNISQMKSIHSYSKANILKEVEKCDVVCSNCHRKRTHCEMMKWYHATL